MVLRTPNTAIPLHRCFRPLSLTFYLNYCVCYKYIVALLRLHTIFVLHGGARRPPGPFCPVLIGPSYPIHTSADFFTFTCNPLVSLPFRLMSLKTCIDASALVPVAGLSSHGGHVSIDLTEEWLLDHRVCKTLQKGL